ncbi:MAG: S-adenosylmethionine:tRNA ribosyltransferase-isomerase [Acidimicrobiales bacterium]
MTSTASLIDSVAAPGPGLAPRPPLELAGRRRDDARLLVAWRSRDRLVHASMGDLADFLDPGDVVVINTSATRPAAIVADGQMVVHLSTRLDDGSWVVELRRLCGAGTTPWLGHRPAGSVALPGGAHLRIVEPYSPAATRGRRVRLWRARLEVPASGLDEYLARHGRPVRYGCDAGDWPIDAYQTVFAADPGSAEMPSAARGFTAELVTRLVSRGVVVAPIVLHTGVASQEAGETPYPEHYWVPEATASAVNTAHATGHRLITVGTTATRAIETTAAPDATVHAESGWTDLVITPERGVRAVDGLLTGWHDPEASHLMLVEAVAGRDLLDRSYAAAIDAGYAGHEFGDFHLVLP